MYWVSLPKRLLGLLANLNPRVGPLAFKPCMRSYCSFLCLESRDGRNWSRGCQLGFQFCLPNGIWQFLETFLALNIQVLVSSHPQVTEEMRICTCFMSTEVDPVHIKIWESLSHRIKSNLRPWPTCLFTLASIYLPKFISWHFLYALSIPPNFLFFWYSRSWLFGTPGFLHGWQIPHYSLRPDLKSHAGWSIVQPLQVVWFYPSLLPRPQSSSPIFFF